MQRKSYRLKRFSRQSVLSHTNDYKIVDDWTDRFSRFLHVSGAVRRGQNNDQQRLDLWKLSGDLDALVHGRCRHGRHEKRNSAVRIPTGLLALSTLVIVQAPLLPTTGFAQQAQFERFCRDYAEHAVNAANRATQAGCTPHRAFRNDFVADRALHYNWCLRSPEQTVAAGRQSRQQALNTCLTGANPQAKFENFCRDYANHAVNVARRAKESLCPSSGWYNVNFSGHYNWCKSAPEQTVVTHRQSRQKALDACLRGSP
jgi:hypothetical protein